MCEGRNVKRLLPSSVAVAIASTIWIEASTAIGSVSSSLFPRGRPAYRIGCFSEWWLSVWTYRAKPCVKIYILVVYSNHTKLMKNGTLRRTNGQSTKNVLLSLSVLRVQRSHFHCDPKVCGLEEENFLIIASSRHFFPPWNLRRQASTINNHCSYSLEDTLHLLYHYFCSFQYNDDERRHKEGFEYTKKAFSVEQNGVRRSGSLIFSIHRRHSNRT